MSIIAWAVVALVIFLLVSESSRGWLKKATGTVANGASLLSLPSNIPWKFILPGATLGLIFLFWEKLKTWTAAWFTQSDMNQVLKIKEETITNWFWLIILLCVMVGFMIWRAATKKPKVPTSTSSGGGFIEKFLFVSIIGGLAYVVIKLLVPAAAIVGGLVIMTGNAFTDGEFEHKVDKVYAIVTGQPVPDRGYRGPECDFKDILEARKHRIDEAWIPVTICKDDTQFGLYVPTGTKPQIEYRDAGDRVLNALPVTDFVEIVHTYGSPGGTLNRYHLNIPAYENGFDEAFVDSVAFRIRAVDEATRLQERVESVVSDIISSHPLKKKPADIRPAVTHSGLRPPSVVIPYCSSSAVWSVKVDIPPGSRVEAVLSMDVVRAQWRENGVWKEFSGTELTGSYDAVRWCASNRAYANEDMSLIWTY